ncbi:uncharacterized protein LOC111101803 isoform X2 [Crassostrea virginica]
MVRVKQCPRNLTEVLAASSKLRCGRDVYGNSQYMCLPNVQKSSLVEFCYGDVMGMQEKGNCLEVSEGELFLKSCTTFENGCPKEHFKNTDFYKYLIWNMHLKNGVGVQIETLKTLKNYS